MHKDLISPCDDCSQSEVCGKYRLACEVYVEYVTTGQFNKSLVGPDGEKVRQPCFAIFDDLLLRNLSINDTKFLSA